jgi:hypothetical protein
MNEKKPGKRRALKALIALQATIPSIRGNQRESAGQ